MCKYNNITGNTEFYNRLNVANAINELPDIDFPIVTKPDLIAKIQGILVERQGDFNIGKKELKVIGFNPHASHWTLVLDNQ